MENDAIINRVELAERLDHDFDLFKELTGLFFDDSLSLLKKIEDAIKIQDADLLRKTAHTLKGAVSNFSAQRAYDAAYHLEMAGKTGTTGETGFLFSALEKEIDAMINEMKKILDQGSF